MSTSDRFFMPISKTADLVITKNNTLAIKPGLLSNAQEPIEIGPLNDETIEHFIYALQHIKVHA